MRSLILLDSLVIVVPILIAVGAVILLVAAFIIGYTITKKKLSKNTKDNFEILLEALGGKGNILLVTNSRSRITLKLIDTSLIDREKLTEAGVASVITMSEKISLVFNEDASKTAQKFQNLL